MVDLRPYELCQVVTLAGACSANAGLVSRLLTPFDQIRRIGRSGGVRVVRQAVWRSALRAVVARSHPPGGLRAITGARMDVLPHQLEPALALVRGRGTRVLIADEVGLGKTVQAGIAVSELRARGVADRVLIVTPAGLREQWQRELRCRFGLEPVIVDPGTVRERLATIPAGTNPWTTWPIAVSSIDYVKRAEVLNAVLACQWDVVIVDEAHHAMGPTDRHAAVHALARRAVYVLLVTASPHGGDPALFDSLCGIGAHDDRLLVFRRTRRDAGMPSDRRVHRLSVRPSAAEAGMHAALASFAGAVHRERGNLTQDAWLALGVLYKRAFSSAYALHRSTMRRLEALAVADAEEHPQLALPLDPTGETDAADDPPDPFATLALRDAVRERSLLGALAQAAHDAIAGQSKIRVLTRILNRIAEPVLVFTEFRDTLEHVGSLLRRPVALLHGGLSRRARADALALFGDARCDVLLATDAAGEGLNLHERCRVVVNLELPWNPMRLEQRIGRVDRIGQHRRVHAFHLIAADTGERRLLDRLRHRIAVARADVGAADPLGFDEAATAQLVVAGVDVADAQPLRAPALHCERDAPVEAERLDTLRTLRLQPLQGRAVSADALLVTRARNRATRARLGSRRLAVCRIAIENRWGLAIEESALGALLPAVERTLLPALPEVAEAAERWHGEAILIAHAFRSAVLTRAAAIRDTFSADPATLYQPGLFDRRADRARATVRVTHRRIADVMTTRVAALTRDLEGRAVEPRVLLVIGG